MYKKFDFFYRRTAFRSMNEYFKDLFNPILKKWKEGDRKSVKSFVQTWKEQKMNSSILPKSADTVIKTKLNNALFELDQSNTKEFHKMSASQALQFTVEEKQCVKDLMRKQDLFHKAYCFAKDLFGLKVDLMTES